ncbi:hypothetical protein AB205_0054880 [Aquarana catesbeiana]|uniref:Uncharacterized protein n=1 Tax=Aquarana catesbeiana TaxID=8400 RepID=A0A2G9R4H7_AQUCT|nr:hypothetical protein AB205_0054880 [Aquarana catesbeiana]
MTMLAPVQPSPWSPSGISTGWMVFKAAVSSQFMLQEPRDPCTSISPLRHSFKVICILGGVWSLALSQLPYQPLWPFCTIYAHLQRRATSVRR